MMNWMWSLWALSVPRPNSYSVELGGADTSGQPKFGVWGQGISRMWNLGQGYPACGTWGRDIPHVEPGGGELRAMEPGGRDIPHVEPGGGELRAMEPGGASESLHRHHFIHTASSGGWGRYVLETGGATRSYPLECGGTY
jgi:hypothetical protein